MLFADLWLLPFPLLFLSTPLSATADFHHSLDGIAFGVDADFGQAAVFGCLESIELFIGKLQSVRRSLRYDPAFTGGYSSEIKIQVQDHACRILCRILTLRIRSSSKMLQNS